MKHANAKLICLMLIIFGYTFKTQAKVNEEYCYQNNYILDCFESLKFDLKDPHKNQLNQIVKDIKASNKKPGVITIVGHGVQHLASDPVAYNATNRARVVEEALVVKLKAKGIKVENISFNHFGAESSVPINSNSNQTERALSRRVEVTVDYRESKEELGGKCKKRPAIVKRLNAMPDHVRSTVSCLSRKYKKHFSCKSELTGGYKWGAGKYTAIETVPRFLKGKPPFKEYSCKNLKGKKLRACLSHIDKEIMLRPNSFKKDLVYLSQVLGAPPRSIQKSPECKMIRGIHKVSKNPHEIYSCYKAELEEKFEICF